MRREAQARNPKPQASFDEGRPPPDFTDRIRDMDSGLAALRRPGMTRRLFPPELALQFALRAFEPVALRLREILAGAVDIESQHR